MKDYDWLDTSGSIGIDLPGGWAALVDAMTDGIDREVAGTPAKVHVLQAKEKFGGLRFYHRTEGASDGMDGRIRAIVDAAEEASFKTCVTCGSPGTMRNVRGWYAPYCDPHNDESMARR